MMFYAWFSGYRDTSPATPLIPRNRTALLEGLCHHDQIQVKQNNTKISPKCNICSGDSLDHLFFSFHSATGSFTISHRCPKKSLANTGCRQQQSRLRENVCSTKVTNIHQKLPLPLGETMLGRRFEKQWEDEPFTPCNLVLSACKQVALDYFPPFQYLRLVAVQGR